MRKIAITIAAALASATVLSASGAAAHPHGGEATYSGTPDRRAYDASGFDEVSAIGPHHVVISVGPAASVRAEGPRETLDRFKVVVEGGKLQIVPRNEGRDRDWEGWRDLEPATYYVTLPQLSAAALVGSGDMKIDRVSRDRFSATVAGSGELDIASLSVGEASFTVAGSGALSANGSAVKAHVSIAGSGGFEAPGMTSRTARISVAGSGSVRLAVDDEAHMSLVGSGDVEIAGNARCTVSGFGSGKARCKDGMIDTRKDWGGWADARDWGDWRQWRGRDRD